LAQLDDSQGRHAAHAKALKAFFKHQSKALAAAAQQQQHAAVLGAWQRQVVRQQRAVWSWRALSQLGLQQQRPWAPCRHNQQVQQDVTHGNRAVPVAAAAAPDRLQQQAVSATVQLAGYGGGYAAAGDEPRMCCGCSHMASFMQRLLQRRKCPGNTCIGVFTAGKVLAAAFRAWHMEARLQTRSRGIKQVWQIIYGACQ